MRKNSNDSVARQPNLSTLVQSSAAELRALFAAYVDGLAAYGETIPHFGITEKDTKMFPS